MRLADLKLHLNLYQVQLNACHWKPRRPARQLK
nr:MAG TPA: hypothetical protein [Caudoviricetes sp.]